MKALIIEDEKPAQINLKRAIEQNFDDIEIIDIIDSVTMAVAWFKDSDNYADIIFMDVELSDGMCFDIFKKVDIAAKVIITTAYDQYAIKAFKINSVDYLLKPIDDDELQNAVAKCRKITDRGKINISTLENAITGIIAKEYKERFAIKVGSKIVVVNTNDIAYFCSEEKNTFAVLSSGKRYVLDDSLDYLTNILDPKKFFRTSRACIAQITAIKNVTKMQNGKIKIELNPPYRQDGELTVSRFKVQDFVKWLDYNY